MSNQLPHHIDPVRLAESGSLLAGDVAFSHMARLSSVVGNRDGAAHVELRFGVDEQGIRCVHGNITGDVALVCQRCLEFLPLPVKIEVNLGIVESELQADRLPSRYDPLMVGNEPLIVGELVEDEILLALPDFPRHKADDCQLEAVRTQPPEEKPPSPQENPFAVLARLKSK